MARALTYNESTLTHEGPRMASVSISSANGTFSGSSRRIVVTVRFVPSTVAQHLVLGPPVESTRQMCLTGQLPSQLCGYFTVRFFFNSSHGVRDVQSPVVQMGQTKATASLSADRCELILAASIPSNATLSSIEALNNEWPVVTVYNSAGLPMYPFVHTVATVPAPPPPPPARPRFCVNNNTDPCAGTAVRPLSEAIPCGGGARSSVYVMCK